MKKAPGSLISICIPTYKRPDLLRLVLDSCFGQTYTNLEIVIGDDSPDDASEKVAAEYDSKHPGVIHYQHNRPSLGQNENVNDLFQRASGDRLVLLHDDDLLLPKAIELLAAVWTNVPELDAAFGKQRMMNHDGSLQSQESTDALNRGYHRIPANEGRQTIPAAAGILQMFPNDGYMVSSELAKKIGYRPSSEVGDSCDSDFGIRLCAAAQEIWYVDEFVADYRVTKNSVSRSSTTAPDNYESLQSVNIPPEAQPVRSRRLRELAPSVVSGYAHLGRTRDAWKVYRSANYPLRTRASARGLFHLSRIMLSIFKTPKART